MALLKSWASPRDRNLHSAPLQSFQMPMYSTLKKEHGLLTFAALDPEVNITLRRHLLKTSSWTTVRAAAENSARKSYQSVSSATLNAEE